MSARAAGAVSLDSLKRRIGEEIGVSLWRTVDQGLIDRFAAATDDHQYIHVDPVRAAAEAPFGGTIAHGFLTLSLLSVMGQEALPPIEGRAMGINYGFDRIRFLSPVPAGRRLRARFVLTDLSMRTPREAMLCYRVTVELEGSEKPALLADWITLTVLG
jgi:acyl dehydratase